LLQQLPQGDPWHVLPKPFPHRALLVIVSVDTGEADENLVEVCVVKELVRTSVKKALGILVVDPPAEEKLRVVTVLDFTERVDAI
jgi:hypothetical protein